MTARKHKHDDLMSFEEVVQYVMHIQNCTEAEAVQAIIDKIDSGELAFFTKNEDGRMTQFRLLNGSPLEEQ